MPNRPPRRNKKRNKRTLQPTAGLREEQRHLLVYLLEREEQEAARPRPRDARHGAPFDKQQYLKQLEEDTGQPLPATAMNSLTNRISRLERRGLLERTGGTVKRPTDARIRLTAAGRQEAARLRQDGFRTRHEVSTEQVISLPSGKQATFRPPIGSGLADALYWQVFHSVRESIREMEQRAAFFLEAIEILRQDGHTEAADLLQRNQAGTAGTVQQSQKNLQDLAEKRGAIFGDPRDSEAVRIASVAYRDELDGADLDALMRHFPDYRDVALPFLALLRKAES